LEDSPLTPLYLLAAILSLLSGSARPVVSRLLANRPIANAKEELPSELPCVEVRACLPESVCPKASARKRLLEPKCICWRLGICWRPGMWAYEAERGAVRRKAREGGNPLPLSNSLFSGPEEPPVRPVGEKEDDTPGGVASVEGSIRGRQHL
jgi:hypothetical protein